jgi:sorting nexin-7/30/sorting nexin-8
MSTEQEPDQLQVKQQLLKAEIIDKNLDQMKFLQYCISQKENGDDLNNWTLEELKTCVNNFQESLKPKQSSSLNFFLSTAKSNTQPQPQPQTQPQQIQFQQYPQNMQYPYPNNPNQFNNQPYQNISPYQQNYQQYNQPYQQFNPSFQQQYNPSLTNTPLQGNQIPQQGPALIQSVTTLNPLQQMLNSEKMQQKINTDIQDLNIEYTKQSPPRTKFEVICKKAEKTVLNDKDIKVIIQNPKTTEKSLLASQFTIYEVCTESMHWLVHRRYSDFDWLRTILCKFYPRILIPPIPGKKVGNRRFEEDFIEKRMKFLQKFMDELMKNEELKSSEALYSFLSFNDRVQFERKIKELNNIVTSQYCEDLKTISGKLTVLYDDYNENYYINLNNYYKLQYQVLTRLNYNMKNFYRNMTMACMSLEEVHKDFETLNILNSKVKIKEQITKTYEELSIFFKNWKRILFNENEIIKENIKDFFKFHKMENLSFIELIDSRELIRQKYAAEKARLDAKKEKLYKIMDFNKWEIEDNFNQVDRALLFRDKNYAFDKMCTRETQALENIHKMLGYANFMNSEQLKNIIEYNSKKFVEVTKEFANKFYPSLNDGITLWSTLNTYA